MPKHIIVSGPLRGLRHEEARRALPAYLFSARALDATFAESLMQRLIQGGINLALRPRKGQVGDLAQEEVDEVYSREARTYDWKHHMTTARQDTIWRRAVGWTLTTMLKSRTAGDTFRMLDLCTGTGRTVEEVDHVLGACYARIGDLPCAIEVTGLDYNEAMLAEARRHHSNFARLHGGAVAFVQGDATKLSLPTRHFDFVSQMFGIGGIKTPVPVFREALRVLRSGGKYLLIDMHMPIAELPGESALVPFRYRERPAFEWLTYLKTTIPLALARLWGWRDTTLDFYLAPLVTFQDDGGGWWGFEEESRHFEPERWWAGYAVMPTMRLLLKKVRITPQEAERRQGVLAAILAHTA